MIFEDFDYSLDFLCAMLNTLCLELNEHVGHIVAPMYRVRAFDFYFTLEMFDIRDNHWALIYSYADRIKVETFLRNAERVLEDITYTID